jgi:predicted cupin superfamily sugar epimerase
MTADEIIRRLQLVPHPAEGGFYRETYRSSAAFEPGALFTGRRSVGTAIYFLLTAETFSAMHRLPGDEVYHFYLGDPVELLELHPDGRSGMTVLGADLTSMTVQHVVRGGAWQGSRLASGGAWALLGTTMAPGFDFADYEAGTAPLADRYPVHADRIHELTVE